MEGFVAIVGFWTFAILCLLRFTGVIKPSSNRAIQMQDGEIQHLKMRIAELETQLGSVQHSVLEIKDGQDFLNKLLVDKDKTAAKSGS